MRSCMSPICSILDEPTSGLDPNQIRQVRELIQQSWAPAHHPALDSHPAGSRDDLQSRSSLSIAAGSRPATRRRIWLNQMRTATGVRAGSKDRQRRTESTELKAIAGVKDVSLATDGDWQIFPSAPKLGRRSARRSSASRVSARWVGARTRSARLRSRMSSSRSLMRMRSSIQRGVMDCETKRRNKNRGYTRLVVWQSAIELFELVWKIAYVEAKIDFASRAQAC